MIATFTELHTFGAVGLGIFNAEKSRKTIIRGALDDNGQRLPVGLASGNP
jgi:hypothetical protein